MSTRVPETIDAFNKYIGTTDDYNQAGTPTSNGLRLGLTDGNITDWTARREDWRDNLFPKYSDPATSTSIVKKDVRDFMSNFKGFASPLLNIISASPNGNSTDAATYNVVLDNEHHKPTHPNTPIADSVMAVGKPIGGGDIDFTCRSTTDSKNASIPAGADSVQVAFSIGTPPANVTEATSKELFTHAHFILNAGAGNAGKKLYTFMRFYNIKHPALAGPWSELLTIPIN